MIPTISSRTPHNISLAQGFKLLSELALSMGPQQQALAVASKCVSWHIPSVCLTGLKNPTELDDWPSTILIPWVEIKENPNTPSESGWGTRREVIPCQLLTDHFGNESYLVWMAGERSPVNTTHLHCKQDNTRAIMVLVPVWEERALCHPLPETRG